MDLQHLEHSIKNIELSGQSINNIAQYCIRNNKNNENDICAIFQNAFYTSSSRQRRLAILLVISSIFVATNRIRYPGFIKAFATKCKTYIAELAKSDDLRINEQIIKMLSIWTQQSIFHMNFIKKLQQAAAPIYERMSKKGEKKDNLNFKYGKAFLLQIADVKAMKPCQKIYDNYVVSKKLQTDLASLYQQCNKLDPENPSQQAILRSKELLKKSQSYKERLVKLVEDYHNSFALLQFSVNNELKNVNIPKTN